MKFRRDPCSSIQTLTSSSGLYVGSLDISSLLDAVAVLRGALRPELVFVTLKKAMFRLVCMQYARV